MVVTYAAPRPQDEHEKATHAALARALAAVTGRPFAGEYDPTRRYDSRLYFVPSDTLLADAAGALGIRTRDDLFGGVVPYAFVATKAIVHRLVDAAARAPRGWSPAFAERVRDVVLPGYTAFCVEDARRAALELLRAGPVRLKPGHAVGGHDQRVLAGPASLDAALDDLDTAQLARFGLAIELDLAAATTYSIGQVWVAGIQATYVGTQRTTHDNDGRTVFGGSDLLVARGGFDALAVLPLAPAARLAASQARVFDAATGEFAAFYASRRNYDAVHGLDAGGRWRCGILEQSWRIGGASGPEVAALAAFRADPGLRVVRARCEEAYGIENAPPDAIVHFNGIDRRLGRLTKYTRIEAHEAAL
jgi:hypothetical protein